MPKGTGQENLGVLALELSVFQARVQLRHCLSVWSTLSLQPVPIRWQPTESQGLYSVSPDGLEGHHAKPFLSFGAWPGSHGLHCEPVGRRPL